MFGIDDKIASNSFLTSDCCWEIFSILKEIFLDFSNSALSLDLDISFFFCSKVSLS